jgi:hypothetical protein
MVIQDLFPVHYLETPKTSESLASLRKDIEMNIAQQEALDARTKLSQKCWSTPSPWHVT